MMIETNKIPYLLSLILIYSLRGILIAPFYRSVAVK